MTEGGASARIGTKITPPGVVGHEHDDVGLVGLCKGSGGKKGRCKQGSADRQWRKQLVRSTGNRHLPPPWCEAGFVIPPNWHADVPADG
jgi:hypothetical protein